MKTHSSCCGEEAPDRIKRLVQESLAQAARDDRIDEDGQVTLGRYDFDLAEFPLFRFEKPKLRSHDRDEPLVYTDTIVGRNGEHAARTWKAFPGRYGFGGPSTHVLFYDLLQLYVEQGAVGSHIQFGTLHALLRRRQPQRHFSQRDYDRARRDMEVLCGYRFETTNAFWDRTRSAYVDMNWNLFNSVFYFKERAKDTQALMPFGFIEASSVLQQIARTQGFFCLGFARTLFYQFKPLEARLAVYLSKMFLTQKMHRRHVDELARALPIEAARPRDARRRLQEVSLGLVQKGLPTLRRFFVERSSRSGRWIITFERATRPGNNARPPMYTRAESSAEVEGLVLRITEAVGDEKDSVWWRQCAQRLGRNIVDRALGQLKDALNVQSKGALLSHIFKELAREQGVALR